MPVIWDICNPGLVLAMDFQGQGGDSESGSDKVLENELGRIEKSQHWEDSLLNILESNDFDAIPLVSEPKGYPDRIARRRYHDGDHSDLFVLDIEEVEVFKPNSSIIDTVFSVLSNEHHIALIGSGDSLDSIVTLDTLASPRSKSPVLRRYLDQKVADVASSTGEGLPADLGRMAFEGIRRIAALIDSDRGGVSDREFTQMVIDTLVILQPLKGHSRTEVDKEESRHWHSSRIERGGKVASDFCKHFMVGVMRGDSLSVAEEARDSLGLANDFSNILLFSPERSPLGLFRESGGSWTRSEVSPCTSGVPLEEVLRQLANISKKGGEPLVVVQMGEGTFGIITREEASSEVPVFWLLKNLAVLENRCREWLIDQGVDDLREYKTRWGETIPIENASFGQILRDDERFSDAVGGVHKIRSLVNFRNELVHKVVAERSHLDLGEMGRALDAKANLERLIST